MSRYRSDILDGKYTLTMLIIKKNMQKFIQTPDKDPNEDNNTLESF